MILYALFFTRDNGESEYLVGIYSTPEAAQTAAQHDLPNHNLEWLHLNSTKTLYGTPGRYFARPITVDK